MAKPYRPYCPEQMFLLPPTLQEWLPENHLAYFVSDVVDELDLSAIESYYEKDDRGQPPYHPRMMTKVLVYGYCVGVFSSRKIQKRLVEDVAFRLLAAGNQPDFRTISDFRKIHHQALEGLFQQVLRLALEAGAIKLGRVALDGTKVKANASKHKAMSYGRMKEQERSLREEVRELLSQAKAADEEEDARYGKDKSGDETADQACEPGPPESRLVRRREQKRFREDPIVRQARTLTQWLEQQFGTAVAPGDEDRLGVLPLPQEDVLLSIVIAPPVDQCGVANDPYDRAFRPGGRESLADDVSGPVRPNRKLPADDHL